MKKKSERGYSALPCCSAALQFLHMARAARPGQHCMNARQDLVEFGNSVWTLRLNRRLRRFR
jgi:hypothetical protein